MIGRRKRKRYNCVFFAFAINSSLQLFGVCCLIYLLDLQFHFDQSKVRSEIRLREGRLKPIDVLCKHLDGSDDLDIELSEPYMVFKVFKKIILYCKAIGVLSCGAFSLRFILSWAQSSSITVSVYAISSIVTVVDREQA